MTSLIHMSDAPIILMKILKGKKNVALMEKWDNFFLLEWQ